MYGRELISKYFSDHPDTDFNEKFREGGGFFCGTRNAIYEYQRISDTEVKILYNSTSEFRNKPIYENGERVGHYRLKHPHTIIRSKGSFILKGVSKLREIKSERDPYDSKDVKIRKSYWPWSKKLIVKISNIYVSILIECESIIPDSYDSKQYDMEKLREEKRLRKEAEAKAAEEEHIRREQEASAKAQRIDEERIAKEAEEEKRKEEERGKQENRKEAVATLRKRVVLKPNTAARGIKVIDVSDLLTNDDGDKYRIVNLAALTERQAAFAVKAFNNGEYEKALNGDASFGPTTLSIHVLDGQESPAVGDTILVRLGEAGSKALGTTNETIVEWSFPKLETPTTQSKDTPSEEDKRFTQYSVPTRYEQEFPWKYPVAITPAKGCIVRSHREGATKRRGHKDVSFENSIRSYFGNQFIVSGTVRLVTGEDTRAYEPDIAIIDESSGLNIRIDIEIDEPYAGITRQATHCIGEDDLRDIYFIERGWVVIRFTEYQVHQQENECLAFIAKYLKAINPSFQIPSDLQDVEDPITENQWDLLQAQKWESKKWSNENGVEIRGWREEYLQHAFRITPDEPERNDRGLNEQEKNEEAEVYARSLGTPEVSTKTGEEHPRDKRIRFYAEPHIYKVDGVTMQSVSTIVSRFFPEFDAEYWSRRKAIERIQQEGGELTEENIQKVATQIANGYKDSGDAASRAGTFLHEQIEKFYLQKPYEQPEEFRLFQQFVEEHRNLEPFHTEWRVFDERKSIAGTIDLIVRNGNGFDLYDWKRSKKLINPNDGTPITTNGFQQGIGGLQHIDDTSFNRYSIQQNIYRTILETRYGLTVNQMYLVVIHPNYDRYYKIPVARLDEEVKFIYSSL